MGVRLPPKAQGRLGGAARALGAGVAVVGILEVQWPSEGLQKWRAVGRIHPTLGDCLCIPLITAWVRCCCCLPGGSACGFAKGKT